MAFNQSKVKSFRRCQKQFSFRVDYAPDGKELVPKFPSLPLSRGSWLHKLQEAHHRVWAGTAEVTWEDVHEVMAEKFYEMFEEEQERYGDLPAECERLFRAYIRRWREHDEDRYIVAKLTDGRPMIELTIEVPLDKWGISQPFKGTIDLGVEDQEYGGLWLWDAKWVKSLPKPDERMMSPQSLLYPWGMRHHGYSIAGFVYNYGRTKPPAIPNVLQSGFLTTKHSLDSDFYTYVQAIQKLHGEKWKLYAKTAYKEKLKELKGRDALWFVRERIPVEAPRVQQSLREFLATCKDIEVRRKGKAVPRTYIRSCLWDCDYHDLCVSEFTQMDIDSLIKRYYEYADERYAEEVHLRSGT